MFVSTFYSYKGGVGRTMALANVASELSRRGKAVLVADFDLEAPGLTSFSFNGCDPASTSTPGLVDFIHEWMTTGRSPDIRDFVYICESEESSHGPIYVMPAGKMDDSYGSRLHQVDFDRLYSDLNGYFLFEDMRAQWERILKVDYALIDSRTGHTDIGGICTRQLPNLVAYVFWPNIQNLSGLTSIVQNPESHSYLDSRLGRRLFVPCNLPLLDDEGDLLRGMLGRFRRALSYEPSDEVQIHHYASLDLLDQKIFTRDRPKSRLATEYKALADAIASSNVADPDGAKLFLTKLLARWPREISARRPSRIPASARRIDAQLKQILVRDWEDTDILRMLAQVNARQGDLNEAVRRLGQVVSRDADTLEDHLLLAEWLLTTESFDDVQRTIDRLLNDEDSSPAHVIAALRLLSRSEMPPPPDLDKRAAILHLSIDELVRVVSSLNASRSQVKLTGLLASALTQREFMKLVEDPDSSLKAALSLALIGAGHFSEAKMLLDATNLEKVSPDRRMRVLFNSAMAEWGATGRPPSSTFEKVIQLHDNIGTNEKAANYFQCIALAHKIIGNSDEALHFLSRARTRAGEQVRSFSCWSYLEKGTLGFIEDLEEMLAWVRRDEPLPQVLRESLPVTPGSVVYYSDDGGA